MRLKKEANDAEKKEEFEEDGINWLYYLHHEIEKIRRWRRHLYISRHLVSG
jgi:hypothetical protein